MKKIALILFLSAFSLCALGQQRLVPDGMGGYIIQNSPNFDFMNSPNFGAIGGANEAAAIRLQQEQIRNQQLQNEILKRKLEQENQSNRSTQPTPQASQPLTPEFLSWKSENAWFETDRPRTEFAMLYAKQLRQERPDLTGRPFFDAVTRKVRETFGDVK